MRWTPEIGPERWLGLKRCLGGYIPNLNNSENLIHMKRKRRVHDAPFKARVALEAIKGIKTVQQIASDYEVHPVQVSEWKRKLIEQSALAFDPKALAADNADAFEREREKLHSKIGQLAVEVDFLKRKSRQLGLSVELPTWSKADTHA